MAPIAGQLGEVVDNILAGRDVPLSTRAGEAGVPEALEYAVLRGLAKEPGDRPSTAAVMDVPSAPVSASAPEHVTRPATVVSTGSRQRASGEPARPGATAKPAAPSYRVDDLKEPYR